MLAVLKPTAQTRGDLLDPILPCPRGRGSQNNHRTTYRRCSRQETGAMCIRWTHSDFHLISQSLYHIGDNGPISSTRAVPFLTCNATLWASSHVRCCTSAPTVGRKASSTGSMPLPHSAPVSNTTISRKLNPTRAAASCGKTVVRISRWA